jgi:Tol biopolymer transport system component
MTTSGALNPVRWFGNKTVTFLASDDQGVTQVVGVDVTSGRVKFLTHHATSVGNYDIAADGTVLYTAHAVHSRDRSKELMRSGFVVQESTDGPALVNGDLDGYSYVDRTWNAAWFIQRMDVPQPQRFEVGGYENDFIYNGALKISPNGRFAIVSVSGGNLPAEWEHYSGFFHDYII